MVYKPKKEGDRSQDQIRAMVEAVTVTDGVADGWACASFTKILPVAAQYEQVTEV